MPKTHHISSGQKFINDLGLYAIGNIGSKLITFLLVPLYTFFITDPADFGYYDICLTAAFIMAPIICLQLTEGSFRLLIETSEVSRRRSIITFTFITIVRNSLLLGLLAIIVGFTTDIRYLSYIVIYGIILCTYDVCLQITRGLNEIKTYMFLGIFNALAIAGYSLVTVVVMGLGVPGIFLANIAARITSLLALELRLHILKTYFGVRYLSKSISHELLSYSLPLLPMILIWWILNSNNLFFIKHYLGLDENGIYAVLCKFTGILYILANIFYQSWQQNAIERYNSSERDSFFSNIFNNYFYLLCFLVAVFPFALRINYFWLVSEEYRSSANYLFLNSLFVMSFSMASFFEVPYQCAKRTSRILPSIVIAVALNLILNYLLIRSLGLTGIIISGIITYTVIIIYRAIDTKKYTTISVASRNLIPIALVAGAGVGFHSSWGHNSDILYVLILICLFIIFLPKQLREFALNKFKH